MWATYAAYVNPTGLATSASLTNRKSRGRAHHQRSRYAVQNLKPYFSSREPATVRAEDLRDYLWHRQAQGAAKSTVEKELNLLSGTINFAREEWGWDIPSLAKSRRLRADFKDADSIRVRWITPA